MNCCSYTDKEIAKRHNGSMYESENVTAIVEDGLLRVSIGGFDEYAQSDSIPITYCPFCGKKLK
jgi:hypothetical protein